MPRHRNPTLREQIERNADRAREYGQDRDTLWRALHAALPLLTVPSQENASAMVIATHVALRDAALAALRRTARCSCGNRVGYDPLNPPPYGVTCERCLST